MRHRHGAEYRASQRTARTAGSVSASLTRGRFQASSVKAVNGWLEAISVMSELEAIRGTAAAAGAGAFGVVAAPHALLILCWRLK